jgi:hypothetical protein
VWLYDVSDSWGAAHFLLKERQFLGQDKGFRQKVKMGHSMSNLHFGDAFIHQILASEVKRIGEMVDLLIGEESMVGLHFDDGGGPVEGPILIGICPFETILI